jgi:hypothetical protein
MPGGRHSAVIYNRVSTQDHIDRTDYNSLMTHEERCLHHIRAQGWTCVRTYEAPCSRRQTFLDRSSNASSWISETERSLMSWSLR